MAAWLEIPLGSTAPRQEHRSQFQWAIERGAILQALEKTRYNKTAAAKRLA